MQLTYMTSKNTPAQTTCSPSPTHLPSPISAAKIMSTQIVTISMLLAPSSKVNPHIYAILYEFV